MRESYVSVNDVRLVDKKKYLLRICQKEKLRELIYDCLNTRQFDQLINDEYVNKQMYICALKALYQTSSFEQMEYHLVMMNAMFDYQSYNDLKDELFHKICKRKVTVDEYCVLRQLMDFKKISFHAIVESLNIDYLVSDEECAKICLLEDDYHEAYRYLKKLDDCQNEKLLNLLRSYSVYDYLSLKKYYAKRRGFINWHLVNRRHIWESECTIFLRLFRKLKAILFRLKVS